MTTATMAKLKKLAKDCIELDNMIGSIRNVKHKNTVVPEFQKMKVAIFEEMESLVIAEQEAEKPVEPQTEDVNNG